VLITPGKGDAVRPPSATRARCKIRFWATIGIAFAETDVAGADVETTLMSGQHKNPVRVVVFNTAEHWSEDASENIACEIVRRLDLAGQELPSSIEAFVERLDRIGN
jgi:allantoicase